MIARIKLEYRLINRQNPSRKCSLFEVKYSVSSKIVRLSNLLKRSYKNSNNRRHNKKVKKVNKIIMNVYEQLTEKKAWWKSTKWDDNEPVQQVVNGKCIHCEKRPFNPVVVCTCRMA